MDIVCTPDGRQLSVEVWGDPLGSPVFLLHGTPGSRLGPRPRPAVLYRQGVRLITFDRPGYGGSDRLPGRRVADAAIDVAAIADAYGLDEFAVAGRSGGGPHALACAALLPERTTRAAVLVTLAPPTAEDLDWYAGMAESNVAEYTKAAAGTASLSAWITPFADAIRSDPRLLLTELGPELPEPDRRVVADPGIRTMLAHNVAEAVRTSAEGWIDDSLAFRSPWGFDPTSITVPVMLWHGDEDVYSPIGHAIWLAERMPTATILCEPGAAHFGALDVLPSILPWLAWGSEAA